MATRRQVRILTRAGRRYHVPPALLYGVWGAESNFGRNHNDSSAGAQGPFQFMPGTAAGLGIDPHNFRQAAFGAAKYLAPYLHKYGRRGALVAYNAGPGRIGGALPAKTQAYIPRVLQLAKGFPGGGGGGGGGGGRGGGQRPNTQALLGAAGGSSIPEGSTGTLALLQALQGAQGGRQAVSGGGGLQAPSFSAAPPMPAGAQAVLSGGGPQPKQDIGALLEAVQQMGGGEVPAASGQAGGRAAGGVPRAMGGGGGGSRLGKVSVAPGADRAGVSTRPHVVHFLERVAGIAGEGITVGTGSNHSQMTVSGNVSDHWSGRAADVPATGRDLIHLGRSALIAAGMSRAKARKISGGLFNLTWRGRRVQVIFNTHEGGDHTNHLHVGLSAPR